MAATEAAAGTAAAAEAVVHGHPAVAEAGTDAASTKETKTIPGMPQTSLTGPTPPSKIYSKLIR